MCRGGKKWSCHVCWQVRKSKNTQNKMSLARFGRLVFGIDYNPPPSLAEATMIRHVHSCNSDIHSFCINLMKTQSLEIVKSIWKKNPLIIIKFSHSSIIVPVHTRLKPELKHIVYKIYWTFMRLNLFYSLEMNKLSFEAAWKQYTSSRLKKNVTV